MNKKQAKPKTPRVVGKVNQTRRTKSGRVVRLCRSLLDLGERMIGGIPVLYMRRDRGESDNE